MDLFKVMNNYIHVNKLFPENSSRKNCFLAVCRTLDTDADLNFIDETCPYGGIIGIGNSFVVENLLHGLKIFHEQFFHWSRILLYASATFANQFLLSGSYYWSLILYFLETDTVKHLSRI